MFTLASAKWGRARINSVRKLQGMVGGSKSCVLVMGSGTKALFALPRKWAMNCSSCAMRHKWWSWLPGKQMS